MKFSIDGRSHIEVRREDEPWIAYRSECGMRGRMGELIIPPELEARDIAGYLDDIFLEYAGLVIAWDGLRTDQTLPTEHFDLALE